MFGKYRLISYHILKEIITYFSLSCLVFSFLFLMGKIFDLTRLIIVHHVKVNIILKLLFYTLPYFFSYIIPISALKGDGVKALLEELKSRLRPGPQFFPADMKTDQPETFLVSEVIREKIYYHARKELPYSSAVTVDKMEEIPKKNLLSISARIHVETDSQKGILIGQGARMIKAIGRSARLELEKMFGVRVYLDLLVRVERNWSKDTRALRRLGY